MFIPQGRVLLTVAVDRLAEVRRLAGPINDDPRNATTVELRAEFYSGASLTTIIHPETGETHTIFPERWGLEKALTWFEKGECLLTSGLVYPRLGLSFNKDPTVSILMGEHDLERMIAKQVKREAASPQIRRGRTPIYDWDDAMNFVKRELDRRGDYLDPQNAENGWRSQADLVRLVIDYMGKHNGGNEPSESEVKRHLKDFLDRSRK